MEAAKNAGLNVRGLINEPTAAAVYLSNNQKGLFVIMDLGGGTFDVTIVDSRYGPFMVQATDGRILGGDNLDRAIMKYLSKNAGVQSFLLNQETQLKLLIQCAEYKKQMSDAYPNEIVLDLSEYGGYKDFHFTPDNYRLLVKSTFNVTIELTKRLIEKNISDEDYKILLVGGSTKDRYYQELLRKEFGEKLAEVKNYDQDTVVAKGVTMCAHLLERGEFETVVHDVTKSLSVSLTDGTCDRLVEANSIIPLSTKKMYTNDIKSDTIHLSLYQGNNLLVKDNELIGDMYYKLDREYEAHEAIVYVTISIDSNGLIHLECASPLCKPQSVVLDRHCV